MHGKWFAIMDDRKYQSVRGYMATVCSQALDIYSAFNNGTTLCW